MHIGYGGGGRLHSAWRVRQGAERVEESGSLRVLCCSLQRARQVAYTCAAVLAALLVLLAALHLKAALFESFAAAYIEPDR